MNTPLRVLLLEDRPTDAELVIAELRRAGFDPDWQQVESEAGYIAALERPAARPYDLILADYSLPSFDGLRALQFLRERELDIPFIMVTGALGDEAAVECIKQGAADYLLKDQLARLGPAIERALELQRLRTSQRQATEKLEYMALHDALTGLYSRAYFEAEMDRLACGRRFPVSLVMVDVDGMKAINDRYGHASGDEYLRRIAHVFKGVFRADDVVARLGGDEFAVLLPATDIPGVENVLKRLRQALAIANAALDGRLPLSLSLGAATAEKGGSLARAFQQADACMYQEKVARKDVRLKPFRSHALPRGVP